MSPPLTPPPWSAVRELFERALPLDPSARQPLFAGPGLDSAVVAEVRALLAHHDEATDGDEFLSTPAEPVDDGSARAAPALPGQRLGAWEVVRPLGSGGMGEVFEARRADGSFEGRAAVKLLKRGMDSAAVLQRFARERNALARLSHPHIARLLDAGASAEGLPFFVMEYVDGRPVHEAALGRPLEQRLQLFLQLAAAVAHAHRNLLVHRDLKPGNVLVDGDGQVKLLDFGIAKALDPLEGSDGHTTIGGVRPFTPHYASPEQVRGEPVSTATDIYSLGVLLYQMLTGARPTGRHATTPAEAAKSVLEEQPTRPSHLSAQEAQDPQWLATRKRLQGDLDNILLKALEKQPERRYASVDAMAADVLAFLDGRPVSARPASLAYLGAKFVQRNRWAVLTAAVGAAGLATALAATVLQGRLAAASGVLLLAGGLVLALVQARQAQLSRNAAQRARDEARQQLERIKRITTDLVFRYGDTVTLLPGGAQAQEAMLRDSVALLEPALQGAPDDLDLAVTMVCALGRLAEIQGNITVARPESTPAAKATVERTLKLSDKAWPQRLADWRLASWTVRVRVVQAQLARRDGRLEDAVAALQRAADQAAESLRQRQGAEGHLYLASGLANVHINLAQVYEHANLPSLGRPDDALREFRRAEQALRGLLARQTDLVELDRKAAPGDVPSSNYLVHQIAVTHGGRALVHLRQDDLPAMRQEAEAAVALMRQNVQADPRNLAWRDGLMTESSTLALALLRLGDMPAALAAAQSAWDTAQALIQDEGLQSKWAHASVQALVAGQLGRALSGSARAAEALPYLDAAQAFWRAQGSTADTGDTGDTADGRRRAAAFELCAAEARWALGAQAQARDRALAVVEQLRTLVDGRVARDAWLTLAEAHALLMRCAPGERQSGDDHDRDRDCHRDSDRDYHRAQALAALAAAQDVHALAADHQQLLRQLQS